MAVPFATESLKNIPELAVTVKIACWEPSFTEMLLTLIARSSLSMFAELAAVTILLTGVDAVKVTPPTGLPEVNKLPVPSSVMVAIAVVTVPKELVADKLKVSLLSRLLSLIMAVRTNNLPLLSRVKFPLVYPTQRLVPVFQYSKLLPELVP